MQSDEIKTEEQEELIQNKSAKEISKKTNLSVNVIQNLFNKKFESFSYPQAIGSIAIIEREFDMELNSKENVDKLVHLLENIMDMSNSSDEMMLISTRQIQAVENTIKNINEAFEPLQDQELEIFSFCLNEAIKEMASITRPFENDEMLDKMFGSFCLGK